MAQNALPLALLCRIPWALTLTIFPKVWKKLLYSAFGSLGGRGWVCIRSLITSQGLRMSEAMAFAIPPARSSSPGLELLDINEVR